MSKADLMAAMDSSRVSDLADWNAHDLKTSVMNEEQFARFMISNGLVDIPAVSDACAGICSCAQGSQTGVDDPCDAPTQKPIDG